MIKIAIVGASGRMGKEIIKRIANDSQLDLVGAIERPDSESLGQDAGLNAGTDHLNVPITDLFSEIVSKTSVVIDFSAPESVLIHSQEAVENNCGVVIGTTGLTENDHIELKKLVEKNGRIVLAPNMSIGVNLLFDLCRQATKVLDQEYDIEVIEMHHKHKKDAPSGTAVKLAEILSSARNLDYNKDVQHGRHGMVGARQTNEIGMHSLRGGDVVGDHTVVFAGDGERIELTHKASSRNTFAKGAVHAAKFLNQASCGLYDMLDVLKIRINR